MYDLTHFLEAGKLFIRIFLVFVSCISLILLIAPPVFIHIADKMQRRSGVMKKQIFPWLENDIMILDHFLFKHRNVLASLALILSVVLFILMP